MLIQEPSLCKQLVEWRGGQHRQVVCVRVWGGGGVTRHQLTSYSTYVYPNCFKSIGFGPLMEAFHQNIGTFPKGRAMVKYV